MTYLDIIYVRDTSWNKLGAKWFIYTWLIYMRDMTHPNCPTWLIYIMAATGKIWSMYMWDISRKNDSFVWGTTFMCTQETSRNKTGETSLMYTCFIMYVRHDLFIRYIRWDTNWCDITHSYVRHGSYKYEIWFIHRRDMIHSYCRTHQGTNQARHGSFRCET